GFAAEQRMNEMWGESTVKLRAENAERGQLFNDGNYAMFIHWGLYSQLANQVDGKTYYGIGEWIMNPRMAGIPPAEYKKLAKTFNPQQFDAKYIAKLAKDAGMKYIIITAKHHDGFAMYDSPACDFNITKTTPWAKDPMHELAAACRAEGLGFGFYYSQNQDWTYPGGNGGPQTDENGKTKTFKDYFYEKCLPQVEEITSNYGPIELVWFDTPGKIPKEYVEELIAVVRKNQPHALVSGRVGHNMGDYQTLGDMEVPHHNVPGMWESVDTTNDSWAYAWYDEYWKTPKEILRRLIASVGRGGTYMLNIGPRGDGSVPDRAARSLRASGEWIRTYPQVVYATDASPWGRALPWGDVTRKGNKLYLSVFEWPRSGKLYLPGLKTELVSARLLKGSGSEPLKVETSNGWTVFHVPAVAPEKLVSVIEVDLAGEPKVDTTFGLDPEIETEILAEFAEVEGAELERNRWMEKFGEWKAVMHATNWEEGGKAIFEVNVVKPGDYNVSLNYTGESRLVWGVDIKGGEHIQNQQNASHNYQTFPMGWMNFPAPGKYEVSVSLIEGDPKTSCLKAVYFESVE
uniref:alpha-L-fucosidase n=1 Tax=Pontiella sp. TaxID=2837462 RepID=UPI003564765F